MSLVRSVALLPALLMAATGYAASKDEPVTHPAAALVERADRARRVNLEDVLRRADEALYAAKAAGRDRVHAGPPLRAA